jgi:hypothetical protein
MLSQCSKCGLSKSSGAMGSVLPQCQCDWKTLSKEDAPLVKWAKEQTAPQRTWAGLTDEEIDGLHSEIKVRLMGTFDTKDIYRAIEAKLKEKNT